MRHLRWMLAVVLLAVASGASAQSGGRRVALLIANSAYTQVTPLANPSRDADLVANSLRQAGFTTVTVQPNLGRTAFMERLAQFNAVADGADVAVIYYAGHGVEVDGKNWLIPVDATLQNKQQLNFNAVRLDDMLAAVWGARLRIIILDACRNNPFPGIEDTTSRGGPSRGLAPVETNGYMVLYAAAQGAVANDGNAGGNSPFARALAHFIPQSGLEIHRFPSEVGDMTRQLAPGQTPFTLMGIPGNPAYLVPPSGAPDPQVEFDLFRAAETAARAGDCQLLRAHRAAYPQSFTTRSADELLTHCAADRNAPPPNFLASLHAQGRTAPTRADFQASCARLQCEWEALAAISQVESGALGGFAADGRPIVLFERHIFSRKTNHQYDASHPTVSALSPGGYPRSQAERWAQVEEAYALDPEAALQSTSFGMYQVLGQNYARSGYDNTHEFVAALSRSPAAQLEAFEGFIRGNNLADEVQNKDWAGFAMRYNGPGYAANHYDARMADAYARLKASPIP